jgi:hypothetical protein
VIPIPVGTYRSWQRPPDRHVPQMRSKHIGIGLRSRRALIGSRVSPNSGRIYVPIASISRARPRPRVSDTMNCVERGTVVEGRSRASSAAFTPQTRCLGGRQLRVRVCLCGGVRSTPGVPWRAADFAALRRSTALGQKRLRSRPGAVAPIRLMFTPAPFPSFEIHAISPPGFRSEAWRRGLKRLGSGQ